MTEEVKRRTVYLMCHEGSDIGCDVYVGSTSFNLSQRLTKHKEDNLRPCNTKNKLYVRMKQVGPEKWKLRSLLTLKCSKEVIRNFESMWINILQSDLNSNTAFLKNGRQHNEYVKSYQKRNIVEKKYPCEVCETAFQSNYHLKQHRRSLKHQFTNLNSLD